MDFNIIKVSNKKNKSNSRKKISKVVGKIYYNTFFDKYVFIANNSTNPLYIQNQTIDDGSDEFLTVYPSISNNKHPKHSNKASTISRIKFEKLSKDKQKIIRDNWVKYYQGMEVYKYEKLNDDSVKIISHG